jgi:hypothetical protein
MILLHFKLHFSAVLLLLLSSYVRHVKASALTTAIGANERLCFYADVDKAGEKIGVSSKLHSSFDMC